MSDKKGFGSCGCHKKFADGVEKIEQTFVSDTEAELHDMIGPEPLWIQMRAANRHLKSLKR